MPKKSWKSRIESNLPVFEDDLEMYAANAQFDKVKFATTAEPRGFFSRGPSKNDLIKELTTCRVAITELKGKPDVSFKEVNEVAKKLYQLKKSFLSLDVRSSEIEDIYHLNRELKAFWKEKVKLRFGIDPKRPTAGANSLAIKSFDQISGELAPQSFDNQKDKTKMASLRYRIGKTLVTELKLTDEKNIGQRRLKLREEKEPNLATLSQALPTAENYKNKARWWTIPSVKVSRAPELPILNPASQDPYAQVSRQLAPAKFFHATTLNSFIKILSSRLIQPSDRLRPGVWCSTTPEMGDYAVHTQSAKDSYSELTCGFAFKESLQWKETENGAVGRYPMQNFLFKKKEDYYGYGHDLSKPRLWLGFKGSLRLDQDADGHLMPSEEIAYIFFRDQGAFDDFLKAIEEHSKEHSKEYLKAMELFNCLKENGQVVIDLEAVIKHSKIKNPDPITYPSHMKPMNWHM